MKGSTVQVRDVAFIYFDEYDTDLMAEAVDELLKRERVLGLGPGGGGGKEK